MHKYWRKLVLRQSLCNQRADVACLHQRSRLRELHPAGNQRRSRGRELGARGAAVQLVLIGTDPATFCRGELGANGSGAASVFGHQLSLKRKCSARCAVEC